jgi:hypothetical protein
MSRDRDQTGHSAYVHLAATVRKEMALRQAARAIEMTEGQEK